MDEFYDWKFGEQQVGICASAIPPLSLWVFPACHGTHPVLFFHSANFTMQPLPIQLAGLIW
jgi:hypothetical protein